MIGKLKYLILGSCLMLLGACNSSSPISPRERSDFNADWRFHLGDGLQAAQPGFALLQRKALPRFGAGGLAA